MRWFLPWRIINLANLSRVPKRKSKAPFREVWPRFFERKNSCRNFVFHHFVLLIAEPRCRLTIVREDIYTNIIFSTTLSWVAKMQKIFIFSLELNCEEKICRFFSIFHNTFNKYQIRFYFHLEVFLRNIFSTFARP